jgi:hypothetical protein
VLADVPAVPERVVELAVFVAPEDVREWLTDLCASGDRLREDPLGIGNLEAEHDRCAADRGRSEYAHLGKLVRQVYKPIADAQLNGHQSPVGGRYTVELLGAERLGVERGSSLGALNDEMRCEWHAATVSMVRPAVLDVLAAGRVS